MRLCWRMGIREIKVEQTDYSQTLEEKLEVLRLKVNEIIKELNKKHFMVEDNSPMEDTFDNIQKEDLK